MSLFDSAHGDRALPRPGSPIRISPDQCLFAAPRSFSQLIASFVGNQCHWHPPCALVRLICLRLLDSPLALSRSLPSAARDFASPVFARPRCLLRQFGAAGTFFDRSVSFSLFPVQFSRCAEGLTLRPDPSKRYRKILWYKYLSDHLRRAPAAQDFLAGLAGASRFRSLLGLLFRFAPPLCFPCFDLGM